MPYEFQSRPVPYKRIDSFEMGQIQDLVESGEEINWDAALQDLVSRGDV